MEQSNLLELAKQGEPNAIAALMNAVLSPKGITAHAGMDEDCLCIFLESQKPLNQETLVAFIQKGLLELGNDSIRSVRAQGKRIGEEGVAWTREFTVRSTEPTSRVATLTPPAEIEAHEEEIVEEHLEEEVEEEPLSFRGWLKTRWRVYAIPVVLVVIGGFIAGGTTAFWSTAKSQSQSDANPVVNASPDGALEKQKEAEVYLKAMTAAQQKFYQQNNRFANSLEELERSANIISQSYSYAYRLRVGKDSVITAIPREADLQSYVGVVTVTASGTESLICRSLKPSVQAPEKPPLAKGSRKLACPARSQKL
ncbi:type IV pilin-like G/H family protein [Leptolyngbya sp. NIES-2104]|uniref:type IV pilin-like G/H family protein n=1 Tax=Leptolyngbya sp. NIES-2104 TaxID=1552121 RepID=UPI0006ECAA86|nr:type IV pilin-like G/H family protein [Leptolyngbya sp. NIES-2104]GAP95260.1 permease of the major facilitator superfamily [Leptolyngbya sp. NIES-2104]